MRNRLLMLGAVVWLAACAQPQPPSDVVRICDDRGCADRPKAQVAFDQANIPDEDPRITALKEVAKREPKAAYDLGLRYFRGDGVRQDSYQALVWMREAGEHGNLQAQKALGAFYLFGLEEMGSDPAEAEKWLSIAVSRGDKESKKLLDELNVEYTYVDVEANPEEIQTVIRINEGAQSIPVIVFDDGSHLTEPSDPDLRAKLSEVGAI